MRILCCLTSGNQQPRHPAFPEPPATSSAVAVANYAQYTGGSGKATASLSPVTIGFVDMQGGPTSESDPEATLGAQAAVKMINTVLGGVQGDPVQLSTCFIQDSDCPGITCGEHFINSKGIKAIADGISRSATLRCAAS